LGVRNLNLRLAGASEGVNAMTTNERIRGCGVDGVAAARRRWGLPALALTLLAGTSTGYAQDTGFGLLDAAIEQAGEVDPTADPAAPAPRKEVDLSNLEGSVNVNEYDLVDLHVNSEDLGAVLQLLSIQSQRNIISSNSVQASVTADLYGVTFYEALDAILHVNGFGYIEKGNFIYVYTREELQEFERLSRRQVSRIINLDYLNATDAAEFVKHLLSDTGKLTANGATQAFALADGTPSGGDNYANTATVVIRDFEENVEEIAALIAELDTKPVQVLVEATILQTSLNEANAFGMDFAIISDLDFGDFLGSGGPLSVVNGLISGVGQDISGADVPAAGADGDGVGIGSNVGNVGGPATLKVGVVSDDVSVFLRVLDQVTDVTVVSNPKLLTLNRQPARVLVGTRVGYLNTITTDTSTTQSVEFLDVGTQLAVRPFVSKNGLIRLELRPQVSSFSLREVTDNSGATVTIPDEDTTEMTTNVMLRDGQTAVLGGLFTETTTSTRRQVPLLGDIPVIGQAFRGNDDETRRAEIIFLITPSIVNDDMLADAGAMGAQAVDNARVGARKSLLPFSRERRVGQLLIEARRLADEGDTNRALFLIDRALRLSPQSPDARAMKTELTNKIERMPSRGIMNGILRRELLSDERPLVYDERGRTVEPAPAAPEGIAPVGDEPAFAEVPLGPVSATGGGTGGAYEDGWLTAEVEPVPETEFTVVDGFETTEPADRFDAMKSVATAEPSDELAPDWDQWAEDPFSEEPSIHQVSGDLGDFGGFLVIPLPGGGALNIEWPATNWDWKGTFTEVPTDAPGIE
jgi:type IV pilus assembly protein PilQ